MGLAESWSFLGVKSHYRFLAALGFDPTPASLLSVFRLLFLEGKGRANFL